MLNPSSIALVGANDESAWAPGMLRSLNSWGTWHGRVHMVNPNRHQALGQKCYSTIAEIPDRVAHAAIVVAAKRVPGVLRDCAVAGVHSATIISARFQEAGPDGQLLSEEVAAICDQHGISVVGPELLWIQQLRWHIRRPVYDRHRAHARKHRASLSKRTVWLTPRRTPRTRVESGCDTSSAPGTSSWSIRTTIGSSS